MICHKTITIVVRVCTINTLIISNIKIRHILQTKTNKNGQKIAIN